MLYPLSMLDVSEVGVTSVLETPSTQGLVDLLDKEDKDYEKKLTIIQKLPSTFVQDIRNHIEEERNESDFNEDKILHGIVFETLVRQEFPSENPIAEDLLKIVQNPKKLGLDQYLGIQKNPDIAYVEVDAKTHRITIKGAADAKFGKLGKHAFNQIKNSGFKRTFGRVAERLPFLSSVSLRKLGLNDLAEVSRLGVDVSEDFTQVLIFPSDAEISNKYCLIDTKELEHFEVDLLSNLLSKKDIEVTTSCFSHGDVMNICNWLKSNAEKE